MAGLAFAGEVFTNALDNYKNSLGDLKSNGIAFAQENIEQKLRLQGFRKGYANEILFTLEDR